MHIKLNTQQEIYEREEPNPSSSIGARIEFVALLATPLYILKIDIYVTENVLSE